LIVITAAATGRPPESRRIEIAAGGRHAAIVAALMVAWLRDGVDRRGEIDDLGRYCSDLTMITASGVHRRPRTLIFSRCPDTPVWRA
jgi:hypothetical protein